MVQKIAGALALIAFALSLVMGIMAENGLATTLARGLKAMLVTFIVGLAIGAMAQAMLNENLSAAEKKPEIDESKSGPRGR